ncbi:3-isopropylmalate dehydratase [PVC group bacterium (ex Bugula neritina AB1)]|nr:3-isopropylmalate dehydratase [PVC group bacterium (ex Bugula neritina AB1)]
MDSIIEGKVYVLGDNIDTDQIIPAEHLVYDCNDDQERKMYGKYALSSVPEGQQGLPDGQIPFVSEGSYVSDFQIIVGGDNFGCGSSREHAPFALREAGVKAIIAKSYARIFFRNSVDGGFYPPFDSKEDLLSFFETGDQARIDMKKSVVENITQGKVCSFNPLGEIIEILESGDLFSYARKKGLIK